MILLGWGWETLNMCSFLEAYLGYRWYPLSGFTSNTFDYLPSDVPGNWLRSQQSPLLKLISHSQMKSMTILGRRVGMQSMLEAQTLDWTRAPGWSKILDCCGFQFVHIVRTDVKLWHIWFIHNIDYYKQKNKNKIGNKLLVNTTCINPSARSPDVLLEKMSDFCLCYSQAQRWYTCWLHNRLLPVVVDIMLRTTVTIVNPDFGQRTGKEICENLSLSLWNIISQHWV